MGNADWIREHGKSAQGKREYVDYLQNNKRLSHKQAILAHCYQCMNAYVDGKDDCLISSCPLYSYMPYRKDKVRVKRERSEKQLEHDRNLSLFRSSAKKTMSGRR